MLTYQRQQLITTQAFNRKDLDTAITLEDAEDKHFACCSPSTFPLPFPAKKRLIALDPPGERLLEFFGRSQDL